VGGIQSRVNQVKPKETYVISGVSKDAREKFLILKTPLHSAGSNQGVSGVDFENLQGRRKAAFLNHTVDKSLNPPCNNLLDIVKVMETEV